jgi:lipoyl(octanoyl) transferase
MRLAHLHLPGITHYTHASHLQEALIQRHFLYKDSLKIIHSTTTTTPTTTTTTISVTPPPDPVVLTFTCHPTYTVGRRYLSPSSPPSSSSPPSLGHNPKPTYQISPTQQSFLRGSPLNLAAFHSTPRGGDLTFHGPGQLTAYPLLDLRRHHITPRAYISLLETVVQRTCSRLSVPNTTTTSNPGVWISGGERKLCAVGVQVRRGITGHGIALNVRDDEVGPGSGYETGESKDGRAGGILSWGFSRIVACGLKGKSVTWLTREGAQQDLQVANVAGVFVDEFAKGLGVIDEIYNLTEEDVTAAHLRKNPSPQWTR